MGNKDIYRHDVIVVGGGLAGLRAAVDREIKRLDDLFSRRERVLPST